jgi:hypothetical protein
VIAFKDFLPLLRYGDAARPIRYSWIRKCLCQAAARNGFTDWWPADYIAESLLEYLAQSYDSNVIELWELAEFARAALTAIGHREIAAAFVALPPPFELSLLELAQEAGAGYELLFFRLLREKIRPAFAESRTSFLLAGLGPCVRHLCSAAKWSRNCSLLRNEIVEFVRSEFSAADTLALLTIK